MSWPKNDRGPPGDLFGFCSDLNLNFVIWAGGVTHLLPLSLSCLHPNQPAGPGSLRITVLCHLFSSKLYSAFDSVSFLFWNFRTTKYIFTSSVTIDYFAFLVAQGNVYLENLKRIEKGLRFFLCIKRGAQDKKIERWSFLLLLGRAKIGKVPRGVCRFALFSLICTI